MTKASSRHSSAAASPTAPQAGDGANGGELLMVEGEQPRKSKSPPRILQNGPTSVNNDSSSKPGDQNAIDTPSTESQPAKKSSSVSSNPPTLKETEGGDSGVEVQYGTRSRNRAGKLRPNYAEDSGMDAEFEVAPTGKEKSGRKAVQAAEAASSNGLDAGKPAIAAPKLPAPESEQQLAQNNHHKDPIPGTSTFSAHPTAPAPTKKRKAANQNAAAAAQSSNSAPRKSNAAAQVVPTGVRETNMLSFENCGGRLKDGKLIADDGTVLEINDHAYLICEPPGEPYYLGRIMEFLHLDNDSSKPIDSVRLNWYYRSRDIGRKTNDFRQVFASMHSDISPLTALRGKCEIKHKTEVENLDDLRRTQDSFWFEKLYDRYIHSYYDVIPTRLVINVPANVKKVLDERWKYIVVEPNRVKSFTTPSKSCKRCGEYSSKDDAVDCAICSETYHMSCVSPPLLKKPTRGFAWACGPCSKAQAKKLKERNTPNIADLADDDELNDEEESPAVTEAANDTGPTSPARSTNLDDSFVGADKQSQQGNWLWRYLGQHCKVTDALDPDDRIHPRASSRVSKMHQVTVENWPGRPVEYVKAPEVKRKYVKGGAPKKETKQAKEAAAALEAEKLAREKRPKWVMDEPPGYTARGEDYDNDDPRCTAQLVYKAPDAEQLVPAPDNDNDISMEKPEDTALDGIIKKYVDEAVSIARQLHNIPEKNTTNSMDVALQTLQSNGYDVNKALDVMKTLDKSVFKEPDLSPLELKKFEDGVTKHGSQWYSIKKHVKTMSAANVVRFYYTWKKTDRGKQVWGNCPKRKGKKETKQAEATAAPGKLQDDVADEYDDSAFDNEKAASKKRRFQCMFCATRQSRQWRRGPPPTGMISEATGAKATAKDKNNTLMEALCRRCAELWRRYAIQWEDIDEVNKKIAQNGGKAWKRKIDEEFLKELLAANEVTNMYEEPVNTGPTSADGTPIPSAPPVQVEPPRKKAKTVPEPDVVNPSIEPAVVQAPVPKKKAPVEKPPPPPPPPPEPPKAKVLPCAVCNGLVPTEALLACKECRLSVHRQCYGVVREGNTSKWTCDMCSNDRNPQVSIQYKCMLCPVEYTERDFVESPPKTSHKKKTEKDREKDRLEREAALNAAEFFRKKQEDLNKPVNPREPLKRTANNNWVHVTCAVFTPEVKFGNAKALEPSEGIPSIASARYDETCKACKKRGGACVGCHSCKAPVHVECAHQAGYVLGFDITPVKGSRRDQSNIVTINGDTGIMVGAVWCKDHVPTKQPYHEMSDIVDDTGINALQLYVRNYKQADLTLTGTVRKATLVNQSTKVVIPTSTPPSTNRRTSTAHTNGHTSNGRGTSSATKAEDSSKEPCKTPVRICATCETDVSPRWLPFPPVDDTIVSGQLAGEPQTNGVHANDLQNTREILVDDSAGHAALAAAALHQNTQPTPSGVEEWQCHKCHLRKRKREPSFPPPVAALPVLPAAPPAIQREEPRPMNSIPPNIGAPIPEQEMPPSRPHSSPYGWPPQPSYPHNTPYSWPRHSPVAQAAGVVNHLNGAHSPRLPPVGPSQIRQPVSNVPPSNGHLAQLPNGYPPSPRHNMSPSLHMQNGTYPSYGPSTRQPPQHLTNGGPPPRAPEHPFSNNNPPVHPRQSFPPAQMSPPLHRDHNQSRENNFQPPPPPPSSNVRQPDGQVNGGASASPSLRNLLS
ncbi:hypothetical protein HYFRA_00009240 [Hymenoscyphus fraxineus]|uniref:BAH-domain-containing protein n=1 Tax=Hymenoscyphus fraxineus TaxID=746836 RepID=A0A9N9KW12_9HELO|nr:hypothetical protein HYFRA_00009240 [Hymenoscyphus fraxineus]